MYSVAFQGRLNVVYEAFVKVTDGVGYLTQADVDAGQILNTATAAGKDPKNEAVTATDSKEVAAEEAKANEQTA